MCIDFSTKGVLCRTQLPPLISIKYELLPVLQHGGGWLAAAALAIATTGADSLDGGSDGLHINNNVHEYPAACIGSMRLIMPTDQIDTTPVPSSPLGVREFYAVKPVDSPFAGL